MDFKYLKKNDYYLKDEMAIDGDNPKFVMTITDKEKIVKIAFIHKKK